jgi:hypothetical protein
VIPGAVTVAVHVRLGDYVKSKATQKAQLKYMSAGQFPNPWMDKVQYY